MGKILDETRGDVQEAIDMTYYMAGEGRRLFGQTTTSELPNKFCMWVRSPIGVCSLVTPWNFPMAIPSWKIMPALICGNTVVIKPATDTPLSTYNLVQTLEEAGVPRGVVNLVTGTGPEVGAPLITHDDVRVVSFTGFDRSGQKVAEACAGTFKHCCLEMGGKNIIMVMDDANLELAVDGALWGGFGTTGQRCTASSRIAVHKDVYQEFVEEFVARARALKVGDGLDPTVQMGPLINEASSRRSRNTSTSARTKAPSCSAAASAWRAQTTTPAGSTSPTIFGDCNPEMRIAARRFSARSSRSFPAAASRKPLKSATGCPTDFPPRSTPRMSTAPSKPCATWRPASSTSTRRPSEPKRICRSEAPSRPETVTAKLPLRRSTSTLSGNPFMLITATGCKERRLICRGRVSGARFSDVRPKGLERRGEAGGSA